MTQAEVLLSFLAALLQVEVLIEIRRRRKMERLLERSVKQSETLAMMYCQTALALLAAIEEREGEGEEWKRG